MIIKKACKYCNKTTDLTSEIDLGPSGKMLIFKCGHSYIEESLVESSAAPEMVERESDQLEKLPSVLEVLERAPSEFCALHQRNCIKVLSTKHTSKHLFPYQRDGIVRAIRSNAKFIFADEMGLGKTIQGLVTIILMSMRVVKDPESGEYRLERDKSRANALLPAIVLCKSIAKTNWLWEILDWLEIPAQVISSSSETPWDMFKVHILSYSMIAILDKMFKFSDLTDNTCPKCDGAGQYTSTEYEDTGLEAIIREKSTGREVDKTDLKPKQIQVKKECDKCRGRGQILFTERLDRLPAGLKEQNRDAWGAILDRCNTIILDEVHLIKNQEAKRTKAVKVLCKVIPHILCMSGTMIKNSAAEYFTPLNLIRPEKYWRETSFKYANVRYEYVKSASGYAMKWTGLIDPEQFKQETESFMIRRTVDEVLPELPKLWKQQKFIELDGKFRELYDKGEQKFVEWYEESSQQEIRQNLLAQLAILRHMTSLAKTDYTVDLALEFLMSNDRKLAIFTHHIDSRNYLTERLDKFLRETDQAPDTVCTLTQSPDSVQAEIAKFKENSDSRIIVLSTLSHGESINLQFMSDSILHERQWNPANEDQAISGRFRRIGQEAKVIGCMIPVALGTIDEYFVELDGRKRAIGRELDTGTVESWNNDSFIGELAQMIVDKGRERWKLQ